MSWCMSYCHYSAVWNLIGHIIFIVGMIIRTKLAAMDNNYNVGRKQARVQKGSNAGDDRYRLVFPKAKKQWIVKTIYVEKDYSWRKDLIDNVVFFFST